MKRRTFLGQASGMGVALALGPDFWARALASPVQAGTPPYGPLGPPDANGVQLPPGFTSRIVARSLSPVAGTTHVWHPFPDGGACVPTDDGGWIYVSNSENPPPTDAPVVTGLLPLVGLGGASAIRFAADGSVVDAYSILAGSQSNCAGGLTPWGTWLSCEEWEETVGPYAAGRVWECDPFGQAPAVERPALGHFKHEMAAVDPVRHHVYLSEDQPDGLLYRYTPPPGMWGSGEALVGGTLDAMARGAGGAVTWLPVTGGAAPTAPLRTSVPGAATFNGGEGVLYDSDHLYLTTKGDDRVWVLDIAAQTMTVLYDSRVLADPVLSGVDNIAVSAAHDLYVAEDGGNMEVVAITPEMHLSAVVRLTGPQHGADTGTPLPTVSEITGLAFSPDGNRLYLNSQRGNGLLPIGPGPGILYEITGPFRGGALAAGAAPPAPVTPAEPSPARPPEPERDPAGQGGTGRLAATGGRDALRGAGLAGTAAAALWWLRRRIGDDHPA